MEAGGEVTEDDMDVELVVFSQAVVSRIELQVTFRVWGEVSARDWAVHFDI